MSGSNSKTTYHPDGFVILSDESSETPPLSCPVCGYFMKTSTDTEYWQKHKCCEECGIKWENNKEEDDIDNVELYTGNNKRKKGKLR